MEAAQGPEQPIPEGFFDDPILDAKVRLDSFSNSTNVIVFFLLNFFHNNNSPFIVKNNTIKLKLLLSYMYDRHMK